MKKEYSTPIAEKIAFNYRDQVVAASAGNAQGGGETPSVSPDPTVNNDYGWDDLLTDFFNFFFGMCKS